MELEKIEITELTKQKIDLKTPSITAFRKLLESIKKYGQLHPIIVNQNNEIIKGQSILTVLVELNFKTVFVKRLQTDDDLDVFNVRKLLHDTQKNIDILNVAIAIHELKNKHSVDEISKKLKIPQEELLNYIDLLKLDNLIKEKQNKEQPKLF